MSARYTGNQNTSGYYIESGTYGNASGGLQWIGDVQNFDPTDGMNYKNIHYHGTGDRNVDQQISTGKTYTGVLTYFPTHWKSVLFALGSIVDTSGTTSTHVISELNGGSSSPFTSGTDNPFTSYSLYHSQKVPGTGLNDNRQYFGVTQQEWKLTIPQANILSISEKWIAQSVTYSSGATPAITEDTNRPFVSTDVKLHLPSGTVYNLVNTAAFTISNNTVGKQYANGSVFIGTPIVGFRDYRLDTGIDADSSTAKTLYTNYFQGGSSFNAMLEINVANNRNAYFIMSGCYLQDLDTTGALDPVNTKTLMIKPTTVVVNVSDTIPSYGF